MLFEIVIFLLYQSRTIPHIPNQIESCSDHCNEQIPTLSLGHGSTENAYHQCSNVPQVNVNHRRSIFIGWSSAVILERMKGFYSFSSLHRNAEEGGCGFHIGT